MVKRKLLYLLFVIFFLLLGCTSPPSFQKQKPIQLLWAKWAASDYLQELSKMFTKETGITVVVNQASWEEFQGVFFDSKEDYDLVGGDSQWLGRGAVEGYYTDLSAWIKDRGIDKAMAPATMKGYAEYPAESGKYWAVPLMGDAMGFAYRKDLFENPQEKEDFFNRYGYELRPPETWQELYEIVQFFYRPQDDLYGVTVWATEDYDGTTMGVQTLLWAWGADLGSRRTFEVKGILNVPEAVEALNMYKKIHALGPPEWKIAYLDANEAFIQGQSVMVMSYFAFFPDLLNPQKNPYADRIGFFSNPRGPKGQFSSLGGQGLSLVSRSKNKENALLFLEWFSQERVQKEWARLGGYTCHQKVLESEEFLSATPFNRAMGESMAFVKDFWVVPEYAELLAVSQKYWSDFLFKETISAEETMDLVAKSWENIFEFAGYYKE